MFTQPLKKKEAEIVKSPQSTSDKSPLQEGSPTELKSPEITPRRFSFFGREFSTERASSPHLSRIKALERCKIILEKNPSDLPALNEAILNLVLLDQFEEAIVVCQKILALQPDNLRILYHCASLLLTCHRPQEALIYCQRLLAIQPADPKEHCSMLVSKRVLRLSKKREPALFRNTASILRGISPAWDMTESSSVSGTSSLVSFNYLKLF